MKLKCAFEGPPWLIQFQLLWRAFFLAKFPHFSSMLSFSVFPNFVPCSRSLVNTEFCHFRWTHVALITISCAFTWKILFKLYKLIQSNFSPSGFFLIFHVLKMIKKKQAHVFVECTCHLERHRTHSYCHQALQNGADWFISTVYRFHRSFNGISTPGILNTVNFKKFGIFHRNSKEKLNFGKHRTLIIRNNILLTRKLSTIINLLTCFTYWNAKYLHQNEFRSNEEHSKWCTFVHFTHTIEFNGTYPFVLSFT